MAKVPGYALMIVRVVIPPAFSAEQVAEEVCRSVGFGHPLVSLLGHWELSQAARDDMPVMTWIPSPECPDGISAVISSGTRNE